MSWLSAILGSWWKKLRMLRSNPSWQDVCMLDCLNFSQLTSVMWKRCCRAASPPVTKQRWHS